MPPLRTIGPLRMIKKLATLSEGLFDRIERASVLDATERDGDLHQTTSPPYRSGGPCCVEEIARIVGHDDERHVPRPYIRAVFAGVIYSSDRPKMRQIKS